MGAVSLRKHSSGENLGDTFHCFLVVSVVHNLSKDDAEESMDQLYL